MIDELIERVRGLTGPDREVDARIMAHLDMKPDWAFADKTALVVSRDTRFGPGAWNLSIGKHGPGLDILPLTASLDAAVALLGRVLPGWGWDVASGTEHIKACLNPEYGEPLGRHPHWAAVANTSRKQFYDAATPAIALILALLSALKAKEARDGR